MDYTFATLDLHDDSAAGREQHDAWLAAVLRGFHDGRHDEEFTKHWLPAARADGAVCRGAWLPEGEFGAGPMPVATFTSFDKTLNAGHELLPLRMITDVTTSPAHRRRGLVRRLMEDDLADAAREGIPVAALTVSEATIYGRWGFGPATFAQHVEVDTGPRFALRAFTDPGRMELLEPADAWPVLTDVFDRFHRTQRGSVAWPSTYEPLLTGAYDFDAGGPDKKLRGAVHLAADGTVDGFVLYRHLGWDESQRTVRVLEMVALTPTTQLALWQFLGSIDLAHRVTFKLAHPQDPLRWALTDINTLKHTDHGEFLWVRVLDVERALAARPWAADGQVVLEVADQQRHAAGRYLVQSSDGRAAVARTDRAPEVTLDVETLGSLQLGGASVAALRRAGRVHGADEALARFTAMADLAEPPYNITGF